MLEVTAYVGLGSNEGDRAGALGAAIERLRATPGVEVQRVSRSIETELQGEGPPQGPFLNAVAELRTTLEPRALLAVMKAIEAEAGRVLPAPRNHPRPLDLDLIAYGDRRIDTASLVVPHPTFRDRDFVTAPLAQLGVDTDSWPRVERPRVIEQRCELSAQSLEWLAGGCTIGLVPTMGALHQGHRRLIERARDECDRVIVTVFVNPLQFGAGEDFAAYPRVLAGDVELCRAAGVDVVFAPGQEEMYPPEFCSRVAVGRAAETMEGALRPGHFEGVATVVAKLFAMSLPHRAYFGEKDAQQLAVIRRMQADLCFPLQIVGCPIVREPDGLAFSSRNVYLGAEDRAASTVLHRALARAAHAFADGERDRDALLRVACEILRGEPRAAVEYLELRREDDLEPLPPGPVEGGRMLVAARFVDGVRPVRLLDNVSLGCSALDAEPDAS